VNGILNQMKRLAGICFQVFHHYFVRWTSPRNTSLLCGTVTDLIRGKAELVAENALLYQQLIAFVTRSLRTDVPSAMTQSVRQENGTSRISSKSGRSMRCTEGSSQHRWADVRPDRCPAGRLALRSAVAPGSGMQRLSREALYRTGFSPSTARNR